ncbi:4Fe-4S dicluster domain-containing protein [Puteibacter caeruleilacunae]|nr:4Fe-4S dicluster domain-containing protein [Puteibacter caeruleilacunae]
MKSKIPHNNLDKCTGDGHCVDICQTHALELVPLSENEKNHLSAKGWFNLMMHGSLRMRVVHPDRCTGCGHCASVCHKHAITFEESTIAETQ